MQKHSHAATAILPCNDLDASEAFYKKLGFARQGWDDEYRILVDGRGGEIHLQKAVEGWLIPGRNPFGLYVSTEKVEELAAVFNKKAEDTPWGMREFALSDPDETLVRIGWPTTLVKKG